MTKKIIIFISFLSIFIYGANAYSHFGMLIPTDSMVMPDDNRTVTLKISFSHPFEGVGMEMVKPKRCGVFLNGKETDLLSTLTATKVMNNNAWMFNYQFKRPGVYTFYVEPEPYWEPAEDCYIIHYTKTVVAAFGVEEGWDEPLGLKTEIIPLTRPFGLYSGNVFQGIIKLDNNPVPYAEIEVEYYNMDGKAKASTDYMVTQVIKADSNGVFTYSVPKAGWWGFAALNTSYKKMKHKGEDKDIELGAVLWVQFVDWLN